MDYTTKLSNNTNPSLMERDKERQKAAEDYCHNLIGEATFGMYVAHKAGSKWADEHPINYDGKAMLYVNQKSHDNGYKEAVDKACEWLELQAQFVNIDTFRKAMEGE